MNERNNVHKSEETKNNLHVVERLGASKKRYRFDSSTKRFISSFAYCHRYYSEISTATDVIDNDDYEYAIVIY